ncbi:MAG: hypothetical protein JNK05_21580 [Myxococcales bacterium]|nr:hypothetical protein [Myxococcales bacterium]
MSSDPRASTARASLRSATVFGILSAGLIVCADDALAQTRSRPLELGAREPSVAAPARARLSLDEAALTLVASGASGAAQADPFEQIACRERRCVIDTLRCTGTLQQAFASIHGRLVLRAISVDLEARRRNDAGDRAFCEAYDGLFVVASNRVWGSIDRFARQHRPRVGASVAGVSASTLGAIGRDFLDAGVPRSRSLSDPTAVLFTETSVALFSSNMQGAPQIDPVVSSQCGGSLCRFVTTKCEGEVREVRSPIARGTIMRVEARPVAGASDPAFCASIAGDLTVQRVSINPGARFWGVTLGDWYNIPPGTPEQTSCLVGHPNSDTQIRAGSRCATLDARRAQSWAGPCCVGTPEITVDFPRTTATNTMATHDPAPPIALSPDGAWLVVFSRERALTAAERAANPVLVRAYARGRSAPIEYRASELFVPSALPASGAGFSFSLELDVDKVVAQVGGVTRRVLLETR